MENYWLSIYHRRSIHQRRMVLLEKWTCLLGWAENARMRKRRIAACGICSGHAPLRLDFAVPKCDHPFLRGAFVSGELRLITGCRPRRCCFPYSASVSPLKSGVVCAHLRLGDKLKQVEGDKSSINDGCLLPTVGPGNPFSKTFWKKFRWKWCILVDFLAH